MLFFFLSFLFDFPFEAEDCELIWLLGSVINPLWSSHTGWCRWLQTDSFQALSLCSLINFNLQPILMLIWVSEMIWSLGLDIDRLAFCPEAGVAWQGVRLCCSIPVTNAFSLLPFLSSIHLILPIAWPSPKVYVPLGGWLAPHNCSSSI